ncbi:MAG: 16S rRNA (adenine(1518)-N(6)/adenine(1519)-N(6))-dimethyltransferase RsmA [Alphaproteobacteria bacterium]|nr:16S rRNA (adenine(1518)-N(6)/adenine(1519)-N(6))-dimethyltransferase RsmA [Alphaproteobacteria bacterium]MDD9919101.1 16S rRNA (adenine(1518)-N(6)/adenine(1519)-N(6))-dimethyltransferase RsmA [Alphaproteobacteria bacterium]
MTNIPTANKELGQHYLHEKSILGRIAHACGPLEGQTVLEIGPGPGALTEALLMGGATVVAVEKDERFIPLLSELSAKYQNRLTVQHADALKVDFSTLIPSGSTLAGNLPYNVGTEIVFNAIQNNRTHFSKMVFLLQKEVIQRICATSNTPEWGRLGVWCDLLTNRQRLFDVAPGAFNPPPKVTSSVVELIPRPTPQYEFDASQLKQLLHQIFTQRRKMLRKSLKGLVTEEDMLGINIQPTQRPAELSTEQLCHLSKFIRN